MAQKKKNLLSKPVVMQKAAAFFGCNGKTLERAQAPDDGAKIVVDGIDVTIPKHLRRTERLSPSQVKFLTSRNIPWAPFRHNQKGEGEMAKIKAAIANREAPVEVMLRDKEGAEKIFKFANTDEFEKWYDPKKHKYLGGTNNEKSTVIMLDVITFADLPATVAPKTLKPRATGGGSTVWADGKEFGSVLKAFETLKLPVNRHKKFRAELKAARSLPFIEGKRSVKFEYR